jgi:hypothetical protein
VHLFSQAFLLVFVFILSFLPKVVVGQCEVFYFQDRDDFEEKLKSALVPFSSRIDTLAVVVHILSQDSLGKGSNLLAREVLMQIQATNQDILRLNADASKTPREYLSVAASLGFVLGLATQDPQGQILEEPGINRISPQDLGFNDPPYSTSYMRGTVFPKTGWDRDRYINIWVCDLNNLLGFSSFPTLALPDLPRGVSAQQDGIVIDFQNFGLFHSQLKPAYRLGRTLTHELGHYFGLYHTFETCEGDDFCKDTPQSPSANYHCDPKLLACDGSKSMFENFMDYANDPCMNLFTTDQSNRVKAVLANSPRRKSLTNRTMPVVTSLEPKPFANGLKRNPVHNKIEFQQELENQLVLVVDMSGKIWYQAHFSGSDLDVSFLPTGIYVVRVEGKAFRFLKN